MYHYKNGYLLLMIALLPACCFSQQDSSSRKNEFSAGVNYQSRLHYFGRTDSLQSSGLMPNIGFQLKCGVYAEGNFIFFQNKDISTTYAGTTIEGGYRFKAFRHFNGNVYYTQILYRDKSLLPQSALKSQTGVNITYTNSIVNINAGGNLKFSSAQTDIGATLGADHIFILHKKDSHVAFAIDPSFYAYAGTQKFSKSYIEQKKLLGIPVSEEETTQNFSRFNILSYEALMPLVAVIGKFNASVTPGYVMPKNLLQGETGKDLFYVNIGVGVRL